jgi:hypothetical protein
MKHLPHKLKRVLATAPLIVAIILANPSALAAGRVVPHTEVTYFYPLDFLTSGPQQGDSAQPRADVNPWYGDETGRELADGVLPVWPEANLVGFNEHDGAGTGSDLGTPQPRIEFDLGAPRALASLSIS